MRQINNGGIKIVEGKYAVIYLITDVIKSGCN